MERRSLLSLVGLTPVVLSSEALAKVALEAPQEATEDLVWEWKLASVEDGVYRYEVLWMPHPESAYNITVLQAWEPISPTYLQEHVLYGCEIQRLYRQVRGLHMHEDHFWYEKQGHPLADHLNHLMGLSWGMFQGTHTVLSGGEWRPYYRRSRHGVYEFTTLEVWVADLVEVHHQILGGLTGGLVVA